jgi:hypothetical protein
MAAASAATLFVLSYTVLPLDVHSTIWLGISLMTTVAAGIGAAVLVLGLSSKQARNIR